MLHVAQLPSSLLLSFEVYLMTGLRSIRHHSWCGSSVLHSLHLLTDGELYRECSRRILFKKHPPTPRNTDTQSCPQRRRQIWDCLTLLQRPFSPFLALSARCVMCVGQGVGSCQFVMMGAASIDGKVLKMTEPRLKPAVENPTRI
jgi:DNA-directed RNA polymerase subunit RPC12/RpoP